MVTLRKTLGSMDWDQDFSGWRCPEIKDHGLLEVRVDGKAVSLRDFQPRADVMDGIVAWRGEGENPKSITIVLAARDAPRRRDLTSITVVIVAAVGGILAVGTSPWWLTSCRTENGHDNRVVDTSTSSGAGTFSDSVSMDTGGVRPTGIGGAPLNGCTTEVTSNGFTATICKNLPSNKKIRILAVGYAEFNCREKTACRRERDKHDRQIDLDVDMVIDNKQIVRSVDAHHFGWKKSFVLSTVLEALSDTLERRTVQVQLRATKYKCLLDSKDGCATLNFRVGLVPE